MATPDIRAWRFGDQPLFRDGLGRGLARHRRGVTNRRGARRVGASRVLAIVLPDRPSDSCWAKEAHKLARILIFSIYDRHMKHSFPATVAAPRPDDIREKLEQRLGRLHARQRLGIETDHKAQVFGQGLNFFHVENFPFFIGGALRLSGLYWRGRRNASKIRVTRNDIVSRRVPRTFSGFKILHLSDLHVDMSEGAMDCLFDLLPGLEYDLCVLTGDYRGKTSGPVDLV